VILSVITFSRISAHHGSKYLSGLMTDSISGNSFSKASLFPKLVLDVRISDYFRSDVERIHDRDLGVTESFL
jgi:hypothetical protein